MRAGNVRVGVRGMDMESSVSDRLWDKEVQEFIEACKAVQLREVMLSYTDGAGGRFLAVTAVYQSLKQGPVPVGYSWVRQPKTGWLPEISFGQITGFAGQRRDLVRKVVLRQRLWREWRDLEKALEAVGHVFFKAQAVRADWIGNT